MKRAIRFRVLLALLAGSAARADLARRPNGGRRRMTSERVAKRFGWFRRWRRYVAIALASYAPLAIADHWVAIGALGTLDAAERMAADAEAKLDMSFFARSVAADSGRVHRVVTGPFATRGEADAVVQTVRANGFEDAWVVESEAEALVSSLPPAESPVDLSRGDSLVDLPRSWAPFKVADIQLQGLQRVSSGTVFNLLPASVGDTLDGADTRELVRLLFQSGYFDDISLLRDDDTLIVRVRERPAIEKIELEGNKAIKSEDLLQSLGDAGLAEGEIFKQATLERIGIELTRSYLAQGRYNASIDPTVKELPRNRVEVKIDIDEGKSSGVRHINFVGAQVFDQSELLQPLELKHPNLLSFIRGKDKYSREKMQGDLEKLEAHYQNRGYVEFDARSVQVSITPDKRSVYVTVNVHEGDRYTVDEVKLIGDVSDVDPELVTNLFLVRKGQVFNRALVTATEERITGAFGNSGFTFASASGVPEVKDNGMVDVKFVVDAGKRAYVRRITFTGNTLTMDEVLRREMRQIEGGWASTQQIDRSKVRLDQLGFFEPQSVNVETPQVPGTEDQIDVDFNVEELPTGAYTAQLGYSQWGGLLVSAGVQQKNVAGSGNSIGFSVSWSDYQRSANFSYHDPYYTVDGISRGFNIFARETNYFAINIARYSTDSYGAGVNFEFPVGETQRLQVGLTAEQTSIKDNVFSAAEILDFIDSVGSDFFNVKARGLWMRSTLNHGLFPTAGRRQTVSATVALPGSDLQFYRLNYNADLYYPLPFARSLSAHLRTRLGYGGVYSSTETYPFYEHFFAGGFGSVRGYEKSTLGPKINDNSGFYVNGQPFGGNLLVEGSAELIFPLPFLPASRGVRSLYFVDAGNVFNTNCVQEDRNCFEFDSKDIRITTGFAISWLSPMGPMSFALAHPFNRQPGDEVEQFSFEVGQTF